MKLETKLGIYFILTVLSIIVGLSVVLYHTGLPWQQGIPIKFGGLLLFYIGTRIFNKHFKINE